MTEESSQNWDCDVTYFTVFPLQDEDDGMSTALSHFPFSFLKLPCLTLLAICLKRIIEYGTLHVSSINRHIPIATPQGFSKMGITWLVYQGELKFMHVNSEYLTAQKIASMS